MSKKRLAVLCVGCISLMSGCYRSARLAPEDIARIDPEGEERLVVRGADGSQRTFAGYDTVEVETRGGGGQEFKRPVRAQQQLGGLVMTDLQTDRSFLAEEVRAVTVWEHAPERPWIIAAASVGAMLLGGYVGHQIAGECYEMCYDNAIYSLAGAVVGAGVGLGVSIPVTGSLRSSAQAE